MAKLAINGGQPVRKGPFPKYVTIGEEEKQAVAKVLDSTVLSKYLAAWSPDFFGGDEVQSLEREWAGYFGSKFAVSVNSATSGLYAAVGATGVGPGDEVIVSPYTMSASATCVLVYNAIPVFADIDPEIFCISAESISKVLTERSKAIIVVDLEGHPADMDEIMALARERELIVIEDAAQACGARYHDRYAGTLADIGVYSLNYHKIIHSGEGGIITTDNDDFAQRLQLIRNHAEVVVKNKGVTNLINLIGFNYRMTEIEAAIARQQLKKLERLVLRRVEIADYLTCHLKDLPGITPPVVRPGVRHSYYAYAIRYDEAKTGISRERFAEAIRAEGVPVGCGYVKPIYLEPLYQQRIAYGSKGCPFSCPYYKGAVSYSDGLCPVVERMHYKEFMSFDICHADISDDDCASAVEAIRKVSDNITELK